MAGELIGALRVSLGLDSAKFEDGLKRSRQRAAADATAMQKSLSGVKTAMAGFAAGVSGAAIIAAGRQALDYASSLGEVAQQLGVTTKDLQAYRFAATQVNISQEEMDKGLAKLSLTMGQARAGVKGPATAFKELSNILGVDVLKSAATAGDAIPLLADAFVKVQDPTRQAALAAEFFGAKLGNRFITLLAGGSKQVNNLRDAAQSLGAVLSDEQIQNADRTADKLAQVQLVLSTRFAGVVSDNVDAVFSFADALEAAAAAAGRAITNTKDFFRGMEMYKAEHGVLAKDWKVLTDPEELTKWGRVARFRDALDTAGVAPLKKVAPDNSLAEAAASALGRRLSTAATGPTAADRAKAFARESESLDQEENQLRQGLTNDIRERARLEHQRIEIERQGYEFRLDQQVKEKEIGQEEAEALKKRNEEQNVRRQHTAVNWKLDDQIWSEELDVRRESLNVEIDRLAGQAKLARTAGERGELERKILDAQFAIYRLEQETILQKHGSTDAERQIAEAKLKEMPGLKYAANASVYLQHLSPLQAYFDSLPRSARDVNAAFEQIAANGIASMTDGLAEAGAGVLRLKGLAGQLFNQLIADVIRLNLQQALGGGGILSGLGKLFGAGSSLPALGSAAGVGSGLSSVGSLFSALPKFATGGSFRINGRSGIDTNTLALNGAPIAQVSHGERIDIDPDKAARASTGGVRVDVVPSAYFDAHVTQISTASAAPMVMRGVYGAVGLGEDRSARRSKNRIPSRF